MTTINTNNNQKYTAVDIRNIETGLINKDEVFRMLALAEATGLAILLVGDPGVAKTKTVLDYAKAWLRDKHVAGQNFNQSFMDKIFILETDEGTKSSEVKGMPDLQKLFQDNKYELSTPIAEADVVVVNEIDKASSNIRNSLLGVMNEKFLFNGKLKIQCKWKMFIGTCNEIPKDEINSPFWDRFMLKMHVNRVTQGELAKYYLAGGRNYKETMNIGVPTKDEYSSIVISPDKMEKFLQVAYKSLSDRTLTFVPSLAQAIAFIWDFSVDEALVKTCEILISGNTAATELKDLLITKEMKNLLSKIEMIRSLKTKEEVNGAIADIEIYVNQYASDRKIDQTQIDDLSGKIQQALNNHPTVTQVDELEKVLEGDLAF
jgi:MoxR-like ATPase